MNRIVIPGPINGTVTAPPSKSAAHRALLCAAFTKSAFLPSSEGEISKITVGPISGSIDMEATLDVLQGMGAQLHRQWDLVDSYGFCCTKTPCELNCRESGSTLRFLLPVAAALGLQATFSGEGRLPERPIRVLADQLSAHGVTFTDIRMPFTISGKLTPGRYTLPGNISSQFISGLMFALPLLEGDSKILLTSPLQSVGYVDMTIQSLARSSIHIRRAETGYFIPGRQQYKAVGSTVEGDWSNAAFWLCAGAINGKVTLQGLLADSAQGDREIVRQLRRFGAEVNETIDGGHYSVTVERAQLAGHRIDVGNIPDLAPVLAVTGAFAEGDTELYNAGRLRMKESDRIASVAALIRSLGGSVEEMEDRLVVHGTGLTGGQADAFRDHRLVMSAAVAAVGCANPVTIIGAESVNKSYPNFFDDYQKLGGESNVL